MKNVDLFLINLDSLQEYVSEKLKQKYKMRTPMPSDDPQVKMWNNPTGIYEFLTPYFNNEAQIIIWNNEQAAAAVSKSEVFEDCNITDYVNTPYQIHLFNHNNQFRAFMMRGGQTEENARWDFEFNFIQKQGKDFLIDNFQLNLDTPLDEDITQKALALSEFIKQPFVSLTKAEPESKKGKAIINQNKHNSKFSIINLRRAIQKTSNSNQKREFNYRWIVNGHWKQQFHPSTQTHKPKYISPYMKGDDNKPLLPPKQTIYTVKR